MKSFKISFLLIFFSFFANQFAQTNTMVNFYPLHVGDVWKYKVTNKISASPPRIAYHIKTVERIETFKDGKKYFKVSGNVYDGNYLRIDSAKANLYYSVMDYSDRPEFPDWWKESLVDSLLLNVGEKFTSYNINKSCTKFDFETVLSVQGIPVKTFRNDIIGKTYECKYAYGFGEIYRWDRLEDMFPGDKTLELVYAKINGIEYGTLVSVIDEEKMPTSFSLSQNYPNPFNPTTTIKYTIPFVETQHAASQLVTLKVYDVLGKEVATLVNEEKSAGNYEVKFNSETLHATSLPSGVYFYTIKVGNFLETKKMVLMK